LDALVVASTAQQGYEKPRFLGDVCAGAVRYALIGLTVYVIFVYRNIPLASMVVGLCAVAAAAMVASVWELLARE